MEHQVYVAAATSRLREALADPARVARAVPGLQQDAGAEPVAGRLKLRVGGHSVTYRGTARITPREDGTYAIEGDATEARGTGSVKLALTLRLADTDGGSTVTVEGTADADGRVTELPADAVTSATTRLLNRFLESLAVLPEEPPTAPEPEKPGEAPEAGHLSVYDTEVPPPSLDPAADTETGFEAASEPDSGAGAGSEGGLAEDFTAPVEPPAEAAHARRTMIGRSAEEVDHAPPRGRYAPVPAPQSGVANAAVLRWAAPAAALAVASAIVLGRALRKRR
ncbi:SRPBCC family protein [Streptomyces sp. L2]|uniref:SRPBCC family protein n=1 Tax=Streptomyces sp. L2 TaxID=2162665 RepID=UPI001013BF4A|nr:SRPBCC family protein [Streptomyces sp. L2]